jgi:hypothetical protein
MWKEVITILRDRNRIGRSLRLHCPRHEDSVLQIDKPSDFELVSPEGGCKEPCGLQLSCGHSCDLLCHAEIRHRSVPCQKPCPKAHPCGHACLKRCSEPCGKCKVLEKDVKLSCGHIISFLECWAACNLSESEVKCEEQVTRKLSACGHEAKMSCWEDPTKFKCEKKCDSSLACGHICSHPCHACVFVSPGVRNHNKCKRLCDKDFKTCSHRCRRTCHIEDGDCGPCTAEC